MKIHKQTGNNQRKLKTWRRSKRWSKNNFDVPHGD
jgi:hypothetical protein